MFIQILFIVIGAYFLILNGILGIGLNWGRSARYSERMGRKTTRIIYAVAGAALLAYGISSLINPDLLPK
jgi:hypothetical protein